MARIKKKVAKGLPVGIKVRKPRYYYQDFLETYNENTTKEINITPFEGLDCSYNENLTFEEKELWNYKTSPYMERALAPYIADTVYKISNVSINGSVKITNNVFSGFSKDNYVYLDSSFKKDKSVNIVKFTTGSNVSTKQCVVHSEGFWVIEVQSGNIMCRGADVFTNISPNTTYWVKTEINDRNFVITISTDGINYTNTYNSYWSNGYASGYPICFGISSYDYSNPFLGTIDFNGVSIKTEGVVVLSNKPTSEYIVSSQKYLTTKKGFDYKVVGNPVKNGYVYENFSANDYLSLPVLKFGQGSWEFTIKATPAADDLTNENAILNAEQDIRGVRIGTAGTVKGRWEFLVSSGSGWINAGSHYGSHVVQANTTYWLKAGFDATNSKYYLKYSTNGEDYIDDISYTSGTKAHETNHNIGKSINSIYWRGSIDITNASLVADGVEIWGQNSTSIGEMKGCLYNTKDDGNSTAYTLFANGRDVVLSKSDNDIEGFIWAGNVTIPSHTTKSFYLKKYKEANSSYKYIISSSDLLVSLDNKGALIFDEPFNYSDIFNNMFFVVDYDIRVTMKVVVKDGGTQVLGYFGQSGYFGFQNGSLAIANNLSTGSLTSGKTYWVRFAETYNSGTGKYTQRVGFIEDNGYTQNTLPSENSWTFNTRTYSEAWFTKEASLTQFGDTNPAGFSWKGYIDLTNTWIDLGVGGSYQEYWRPVNMV